jgi:hypothetical protein
MIRPVAAGICLLALMMALAASPVVRAADKVPPYFYLSWQVLDQADQPVPNAKIRVVALDETGKPLGPDADWTVGGPTDTTGRGGGFGDLPKLKLGKVQILAEHPSILDATLIVDGVALIHDVPQPSLPQPMFILKAKGGPGVKAWRDAAGKAAPGLVESLLKTKDPKEVEALTRQIVAGEMLSVPALVAALQDYVNPDRRRLVDALLKTYNGCQGQGPTDADTRAKASAIYAVSSYAGILLMKPRTPPSLTPKRDKELLKELSWTISDRQRRLATEQLRNNTDEVAQIRFVLDKMEEYYRQAAALPE